MQKRIVLRLLACLMLAGMSACASDEIPFDHSANSGIKTIGILTPAMPDTPQIVLASDVGQSFGLVGALVDAGMKENRDTDFEKALKGTAFNSATRYLAALHAAIAARGYAAVDIPAFRPKAGFLKDYPPAAQYAQFKVDAYLDVALVGYEYGYIAAGIGSSTPYRPFAYARCRLVRASDGAVLMDDTVVYNPIGTPAKMVTIAPDPAYAFTDFDTLVGDPDKAAKGLDVSLTASADAIGALVQ